MLQIKTGTVAMSFIVGRLIPTQSARPKGPKMGVGFLGKGQLASSPAARESGEH